MRMTFCFGRDLSVSLCAYDTPSLIFFSYGFFFLGTISTSAIKLHTVVKDFKMVTLGNPVLKGFEGLVLEFDNLPAIETDQVIMVAPLRSGFISGLSIGKFSLRRQTQDG